MLYFICGRGRRHTRWRWRTERGHRAAADGRLCRRHSHQERRQLVNRGLPVSGVKEDRLHFGEFAQTGGKFVSRRRQFIINADQNDRFVQQERDFKFAPHPVVFVVDAVAEGVFANHQQQCVGSPQVAQNALLEVGFVDAVDIDENISVDCLRQVTSKALREGPGFAAVADEEVKLAPTLANLAVRMQQALHEGEFICVSLHKLAQLA